ncbi:MAG: nucleoside phosphorylase [Anaerolineales bacterium]
MSADKTRYLKIGSDLSSRSVVLVGDPARVKLFAEEMEKAKIVSQEREFTTLFGEYNNVPVAVISVGIGAPSAAIVMEEVWELGGKVVIRAGTGMSINTSLGTYLLPEGAVRYDGVSRTYLPLEFPALADLDLILSFKNTLTQEGVNFRTGLLATSDGFYTDMVHHAVESQNPVRKNRRWIDHLSKLNVIGADMETSAIYTVAKYLDIKTLSLLVTTVDGKTRDSLKESIRSEKEKKLARLVLKSLEAFNKLE